MKKAKFLIAFLAIFMMSGIAFGQARANLQVTVISPRATEATITVTTSGFVLTYEQQTIGLGRSQTYMANVGVAQFIIPSSLTLLTIEVTTNTGEHAVYTYYGYVSNATFDFR
jgi:hypothetical protein